MSFAKFAPVGDSDEENQEFSSDAECENIEVELKVL